MTIYTDHSAVKAVLETPSPSGKHAHWWMKVYGAGVKEVNIIYRPGKDNANADALSLNPVMTADLQSGEDIQVAVVKGNETIEELLQAELDNEMTGSDEFGIEQRKDPKVLKMFQFIENETLPEEEKEAKRIVLQSNLFTVTNDVLYFIDLRQNYRKTSCHSKPCKTTDNERKPFQSNGWTLFSKSFVQDIGQKLVVVWNVS